MRAALDAGINFFDTAEGYGEGHSEEVLAQALLTGKFSAENRPAEDANRSHNILFKEPHYGRALEAVEKLKPIADKHRATPAQLATAWVLAQPGVTSAIVGARKPEQLQDITGAAAQTNMR